MLRLLAHLFPTEFATDVELGGVYPLFRGQSNVLTSARFWQAQDKRGVLGPGAQLGPEAASWN